MAQLIVVYWRDIPAQVIVKRGRDTDAYLADWRRADPLPCGDDLEAEAAAHAARLEAEFTDERLKALVAAGGVAASA